MASIDPACPKRRTWAVLPLALVLGMSPSVTAAATVSPAASLSELEQAARAKGIQCVPFARAVTGIKIFGDAWTWWEQAKGRYSRGGRPRVGAVMAFRPFGHMALGHVAAVSRIVDSRTVLLRHANWSPIDGRTGQIETDVPAVDVSPANDWSEVRVWFDPRQGLGSTNWPVSGFIYPDRSRLPDTRMTHAFAGDPIGAIIATLTPQSPSVRPRPARSVRKASVAPTLVTHFTIPVDLVPASQRRRSKLRQEQES